MLKYTTPNDPPPSPCTNFAFGQVEDYCVELLQDSVITGVPLEDGARALRAFPQPAVDWVMIEFPEASPDGVCGIRVTDMTGRTIYSDAASTLRNHQIYLNTGQWPSGVFAVQLQCDGRVLRGKLMKQ